MMTMEKFNLGTLYMHQNIEAAALSPYTRIIFITKDDGELDYFIGTNSDIVYAKGDRAMPSLTVQKLVEHLQDEDIIFDIKADLKQCGDRMIVVYGVVYVPEESVAQNDVTEATPHTFSMFDGAMIKKESIQEAMDAPEAEPTSWYNGEHLLWFHEPDLKRLCSHLQFEWHTDTEEALAASMLEKEAAIEEAKQQQAAAESESAVE